MIICRECYFEAKTIDHFGVVFQQLEIDPEKVKNTTMDDIRELSEFSSRLIFTCPSCETEFDFKLGTDSIIELRKVDK